MDTAKVKEYIFNIFSVCQLFDMSSFKDRVFGQSETEDRNIKSYWHQLGLSNMAELRVNTTSRLPS